MKPTKSSLTRKLDKECSRVVRSRGYCQFCGAVDFTKLQCCHIFSRSYRNTRWMMNNLLCLCASCHFESHRNPLNFAEKVKTQIGETFYWELMYSHNAVKKWTLDEMSDLLEKLKGL